MKVSRPEMKVSAVEDFDRAELVNKYFTSIVTDDDYITFEPSRSQVLGNEIEISELLIDENLKTLRVSKSRGANIIPPILLIRCSHSIPKPLILIFQNIKRLAKFQKLWKHGFVSPIYKEGRKSDVTNYRPVTLLPIVSKIFEKLIARTLKKQVAKVISREQYINAVDVTNKTGSR